ncbi:MAG: asparaginase, partial [Candidatus Eisenbacteria bacterium]|nr:asparaginase [Candidatus Eisenbacteria bacterium]
PSMNAPEPIGPGSGVLILYTGGTIGSLRRDRNDPHSPREPAPIEEVLKDFPDYDAATKHITLGTDRIRLGTESFDPPMDSSDMTFGDWIRMAKVIEEHYEEYEGFVILHGTDTLAYTSSALAFILENLSKPVILTGSQRPIGEVRTDAEQNLITAVEFAAARSLGRPVIPEVCVFFRDHLYRGCRTTKISASSFNAFGSPNSKPLATAGARIRVDPWRLRIPPQGPLRLKQRFEHSLASLDIFPGMPAELLAQLFDSPGLRGVVLRTFGNGNAPSDPRFLGVIGEAVKNGILVLNATQCLEGEVEPGRYTASAGLYSRGVVGSMDMTREAALAKMFVVLGETTDVRLAADRMQINMRGEQRRSIFNLHFKGGKAKAGENEFVPGYPMTEFDQFDAKEASRVWLRMTGLTRKRSGTISFKMFYGAYPGDRLDESHPNFLGKAVREYAADKNEVIFMPVPKSSAEVAKETPNAPIILVTDEEFGFKTLNLAFFA